jgi:hypothetical protein
MFIKITVKNSEGIIVPIMINAEYISTIEPILNDKAFIILQDTHSITTEETFKEVASKLRFQGLFEV